MKEEKRVGDCYMDTREHSSLNSWPAAVSLAESESGHMSLVKETFASVMQLEAR